jgi:hypothetical protein
MKESHTFGRHGRFVGATLALLFVMAIVALSWTSRAARPGQANRGVQRRVRTDLVMQAELNLSSRVAGFDIVKLEKHLEQNVDFGRIEVWLRNKTGKAITAYDIAVGIIHTQPDLLASDEPKMLPPRGVIRDTYGMQAELETRGVTIMAAIFEDGSTAGDPEAIHDMTQWRQGIQIQCNYSIKLLRESSAAPDSEIIAKANQIESRLAALSDEEENALPGLIRQGYRYQVDLTRHQLQETLADVKNIGEMSRLQVGEIAGFRDRLRGFADRYENVSRHLLPR